jgi:hypothetical protein
MIVQNGQRERYGDFMQTPEASEADQSVTVDQVKYQILLNRIGVMERRHAEEMADLEVQFMLRLDGMREGMRESEPEPEPEPDDEGEG